MPANAPDPFRNLGQIQQGYKGRGVLVAALAADNLRAIGNGKMQPPRRGNSPPA
jgi:hypothetical protein